MTVVPYMHIGLLVADIDEAIKAFGRTLDVPFTPPATADMDNFHDYSNPRAPTTMTTRFAYSKVGPPYYELIEVQERGIFGRQAGIGIHHVGLWESDCESRLAELISRGLEVEMVEHSRDGKISVAFFKPSGLCGMRVELLSEAAREPLAALLRS
jgi:catechol 2,3-dioxygenase-like lactoylglutathione lyase family enzyme